jgi:hypothetical protein
MRVYVDEIKKDKDLIIINADFSDAEEQETMFSAFVELDMMFKKTEKLVWCCYDYLPSSVEIVEPENIVYKSREFTSFLNELQARMHAVANEVKIKTQENIILDKNGKTILENFIYYCLKDKEYSIDELSGFTGIQKEQLTPFIKIMVEKGAVKEKEEKYSLAKKA